MGESAAGSCLKSQSSENVTAGERVGGCKTLSETMEVLETRGSDIYNLFWDYTGIYNVDDVPGNAYLKYLTLDYDYLGNEYFELDVINDNTIALLHENSGTVYTFRGKGYIQYKNTRGKLRLPKATIEKQMKKISRFDTIWK